jgi:chorismate dehydratase
MSERFRISPPSVWRVGALRDLYTHPLYRSLKSSPALSGELLFDTAAAHIDRILSNECDAAFVAPMEYAVNSSDLVIVPHVGVAASGFSDTIRLYLRDDVKAIRTMAVGTVTTTDVVLARLILGEKYDSVPAILPMAGTVEAMLAKADCALLSGDPLQSVSSPRPFIDLVDEWTDITELPFVHTLCVAKNGSLPKGLSDLLISSVQAGRIELTSVAEDLAASRALSGEYIAQFLSRFSYGFDDISRQSLEAFMEMAFLHGILPDVPEINLGSEGD